MRSLKASVAVLLLLAAGAGIALAAEPAPAKPNAASCPEAKPGAAPCCEMAVFSVPNLMEGTTVKTLAKALADKPGVIAAEVDSAQGTFNVTFESKKTKPDKILKSLNSVAKGTTLSSVAPVDPKTVAKHDCGKCPLMKSCAGKKK